ncbi:MAG: DUF2007 domain-containing protein [Proteobacteria bacterium]|nr:DUF2007 domain-containing protein [Pseudomonadota bacterium]
MKLLEQFSSINDAHELHEHLRSNGILSHLSSKNSYMLSGAKTGALRVGVWVVLDKQWSDAKALMGNTNHKVIYPLSEEEMSEMETNAAHQQSQIVANYFTRLAAWFFGLLLSLIIVYVIYGMLIEAK